MLNLVRKQILVWVDEEHLRMWGRTVMELVHEDPESSASSTHLSPQLLDINIVCFCVAVRWKQRTVWAQLFLSEPFLC